MERTLEKVNIYIYICSVDRAASRLERVMPTEVVWPLTKPVHLLIFPLASPRECPDIISAVIIDMTYTPSFLPVYCPDLSPPSSGNDGLGKMGKVLCASTLLIVLCLQNRSDLRHGRRFFHDENKCAAQKSDDAYPTYSSNQGTIPAPCR